MFVIDPLHYYVVVEALPDVMHRIQLVDPDAPSPAGAAKDGRGLIVLTDQMAQDGIPADGGTNARTNRGAVLTLLVGKVLWVGPGKQVEGAFVKPTLERGQMCIFSPRTVSYEFNLHGRSIKIVPYSEITGRVREVAADTEEWRELLALSPPRDRIGRAAQETREGAV